MRLDGGARPHSHWKITQLYALACAPPEQYGRPISYWTDAELADEMMKQQVVDSISPRHVGRLLAEAELKPHQTRYWLYPPRIPSLPLKSTTSARSTGRLPSCKYARAG